MHKRVAQLWVRTSQRADSAKLNITLNIRQHLCVSARRISVVAPGDFSSKDK